MQSSEIMIINRLPSGTAFGATVVGNETLFIPAKVAASLNVQVGQRYVAILIANTMQPDKTQWLAIRIDPSNEVFVEDALTKTILTELSENGSATVDEIAEVVKLPSAMVAAKMQEMARAGMIKRRTFYAIDDADFYENDE